MRRRHEARRGPASQSGAREHERHGEPSGIVLDLDGAAESVQVLLDVPEAQAVTLESQRRPAHAHAVVGNPKIKEAALERAARDRYPRGAGMLTDVRQQLAKRPVHGLARLLSER